MNSHPSTMIELAAHKQAEMREYARKRRLLRQSRAHRRLARALAGAVAGQRRRWKTLPPSRRRYGN